MSSYSELCERCLKRQVDCDRFYRERIESCGDFCDNPIDFGNPMNATENIVLGDGLFGAIPTAAPTACENDEEDRLDTDPGNNSLELSEATQKVEDNVITPSKKEAYGYLFFGVLFTLVALTLSVMDIFINGFITHEASFMGIEFEGAFIHGLNLVWIPAIVGLARGVYMLNQMKKV